MIRVVFRRFYVALLFSCVSLYAGQIVVVKSHDLPQAISKLQGLNSDNLYATLNIFGDQTTISLGASLLSIDPIDTNCFLSAMGFYPVFVCNKKLPQRIAVLDENVEPNVMSVVRKMDDIFSKVTFLCVRIENVDCGVMIAVNERLDYFKQHCPLSIIIVTD